MDKIKEDGYVAACGTGIFGVILVLITSSIGLSNISGQTCGAFSIFFIVLSVGSFIKPESIGQIAVRILKNQQKAVLGNETSQDNNQSINAQGADGSVVSVQGSNNRTDVHSTTTVINPVTNTVVNPITNIVVNTGANPVTTSSERQRVLMLFEDEVTRFENKLNAIPDNLNNGQMVQFAANLWQQGNPQNFENTPIYSQYSREMMQFSNALTNKLINFYEVIQTIHRNENFDLSSANTYVFLQIKAYFDNVKLARELITELKQLIHQEQTQ